MAWGGFLEDQGRIPPQREFRRPTSLQEYPSEGYAATGRLLPRTTRLLEKRGEAATSRGVLRAAKITRIDLIRHGVRMLDDFLDRLSPRSRRRPGSVLPGPNALLEMEAYDQAVDALQSLREAVSQERPAGTVFWYVHRLLPFSQPVGTRRPLEMCHKVSEATRIDPATGREVEARNKWLAIYILGQIYHSLNQPEKAITAYRTRGGSLRRRPRHPSTTSFANGSTFPN